jgi:hypothetical protein
MVNLLITLTAFKIPRRSRRAGSIPASGTIKIEEKSLTD